MRSRVFCGPEASAIQTAEMLGIDGTLDPGLRSLDIGSWRGRLPEDIPVAELRDWFGDVDSAPHGGESIAGFVARLGRWVVDVAGVNPVDGVVNVTVVVAMPVAQALVAHNRHRGAHRYWSLAIAPASEQILSVDR